MCGFRIGYIAACKKLMSILIRVHQNSYCARPRPSQDAALAALTQESDEIAYMLEQFDKRRKLIYGTLQELQLTCAYPQAAFMFSPMFLLWAWMGILFASVFLKNME